MAYQSLRDWIEKLEQIGQLKHITVEVDWNLELGGIAREMARHHGPALLFENIKDYRDTACHRLFINSLASQERVAMALDLPRDISNRGITELLKEKLRKLVDPVIVASGAIKQNIVKGDAVDLYKFPVPKYNSLDGGRYINTHCCTVTMDPDTKIMNVGVYRGMIGDDEKSIPVLLQLGTHWGYHFSKYKERGEKMPVAVVYGCDPVLLMCGSSPIHHPGHSEYEVVGGLLGQPVELVKCETSDLYVPASAEIVVEGWISPDTKTFQMEGPFGEYTGFFGGRYSPKHTIHVECITYQDNPIFNGGLTGNSPGRPGETNYWVVPWTAAVAWRYLEDAGIPGVLGVWGSPITNLTNMRVQIDKIHRGHAKQVAATLWGSRLAVAHGKNLVVVDKDIDVFDDEAVEWALAYRTNAAMEDFQFFSGTTATVLDPSVPLSERNIMKYGHGKWTRVFTDATVNWDLEPEEQYGGKREPPLCTEIDPKTFKLIKSRWQEYGF